MNPLKWILLHNSINILYYSHISNNMVENSLVNNINAKKKKGTSKSEKKSTVSEKAYNEMENSWAKKNKRQVSDY